MRNLVGVIGLVLFLFAVVALANNQSTIFDSAQDSLVGLDSVQPLVYGEPYSEAEAKTIVDGVLGTNFSNQEKEIWQNEKRISYRTEDGVFIYYKKTGLFHYLSDDMFTESFCETPFNSIDYIDTANDIIGDYSDYMGVSQDTWDTTSIKYIKMDGGTNDGSVEEPRVIGAIVDISRKVGDLPSVGIGSTVTVILSNCGDIQGVRMNWRRLAEKQVQDSTLGLELLTASEINDKIIMFKNDYAINNGGGYYENENIGCGYYEMAVRDDVQQALPKCFYRAIHISGRGSMGIEEWFSVISKP